MRPRIGNQSTRQRREHGSKPRPVCPACQGVGDHTDDRCPLNGTPEAQWEEEALSMAVERVRKDKCVCGHTRENHSTDGHCLYKVTEDSKGMTVVRKKCTCEQFTLAPTDAPKEHERLSDEEFKEVLKQLATRLGNAFGLLHGTIVAIVQENRDLTKRIEALEDKLKK